MSKSKAALFSVLLLAGTLPLTPSAFADNGQGTDVPAPPANLQTPSSDAQAPATDTQTPADAQAPSTGAQTPSDAQAPAGPHSYELKSFYLDSKQYKIGDIVPDIYRSKPYEIVQWQLRHLPAPDAGSHWTYIAGNYVMITDDIGKILQVQSGDIFFAG
ncbi:RcnB family protein [Martelella alba]|uniref:Nickel/cobalt transporter regulator n=1 Tax=Martelella alba TaxID=2590451 RepID=A0ABY2SNE1_9HYPH|nr:RcnB family protein [Martelella alba]TKI06958.1 hypothetical protein FCN80_08395 [Martelella alba]